MNSIRGCAFTGNYDEGNMFFLLLQALAIVTSLSKRYFCHVLVVPVVYLSCKDDGGPL